MNIPKPFCFNKSKIKAFVLGADPSNFSDHGKTVYLDTVFGIGSGDHRYFEGILRNLKEIGLGLEDIYVQNLVQEYLPDETSKLKDWEKYADKWVHISKSEFDDIDKSCKTPVLVTAERIMKYLFSETPPVEEIYNGNIEIPFNDNKLSRPLIPFYRHPKYSLNERNSLYRDNLKNRFQH